MDRLVRAENLTQKRAGGCLLIWSKRPFKNNNPFYTGVGVGLVVLGSVFVSFLVDLVEAEEAARLSRLAAAL